MIGDKIRRVVSLSGFKQREFSISLGLSDNTLYYYMSEKTKPTLIIIKKIADKCDINLEWLTTNDMVIPATISHNYQKLIDSKGLSIKDFAAKLNKPEKFIQAIIDREIYPSEEFKKRTIKTFDLDDDYFLPQNINNKRDRNLIKFRQEYPDVVDWMFDKNNHEFRQDFEALISRWRRIKQLENEREERQ